MIWAKGSLHEDKKQRDQIAKGSLHEDKLRKGIR